MKALKYISVCLLIFCLLCGLCACGGTEEGVSGGNDNSVATDVSEESQVESTPVEDDRLTYRVKVVDEQSNPVPGVMVQMCLDTCFPSLTGEDGVATFVMDEADYKVSFASIPEGYTADGEEFYFEDDSTEMTICLTTIEE